jgi:hypothetical protein
MKTVYCAVLAVSSVLLASAAGAQTSVSGARTIRLTPERAARWDSTIHIGWFGGNNSDVSSDWDRWYDAAAFDAGAGFYLTPHLKLEADVATTVKAGMSIPETATIPGDPYPFYYRTREHRFRTTTVSGALVYQFFENDWFHPYTAVGVGVERETEEADFQAPHTFFRDSQTRVLLPALPALDEATTSVHPFVTLGFKAYIAERVFFRMGVRTAASGDGIESLLWRTGFGVDF